MTLGFARVMPWSIRAGLNRLLGEPSMVHYAQVHKCTTRTVEMRYERDGVRSERPQRVAGTSRTVRV